MSEATTEFRRHNSPSGRKTYVAPPAPSAEAPTEHQAAWSSHIRKLQGSLQDIRVGWGDHTVPSDVLGMVAQSNGRPRGLVVLTLILTLNPNPESRGTPLTFLPKLSPNPSSRCKRWYLRSGLRQCVESKPGTRGSHAIPTRERREPRR